jgi:hypothetical protein
MCRLLVYVVFDDEMFGCRGSAFDAIGEIVFCLLDQIWGVEIVIVCIDIKIRLWWWSLVLDFDLQGKQCKGIPTM